jgi:hypothetical protein
VDSDGSIWLAEYSKRSISAFSSSGVFIRRLPLTAANPSVQSLGHLSLSGDTIQLVDGPTRRTLFFSKTGQLLRTTYLPRQSEPNTGSMLVPVGQLSADSSVAAWSVSSAIRLDGVPVASPIVLVVSGKVVDTLAFGLAVPLIDLGNENVGHVVENPFAHRRLLASSHDLRWWATVDTLRGDRGPVSVALLRVGRPSDRFPVPAALTAPTPRLVDSIIFAVAGNAERERRLREVVKPPAHLDPFAGVFVSEDGDVWLRSNSGLPAASWTVVRGRNVGARVELPAGTEPILAIGPRLFARSTTPMGESTIIAYTLARSP